MLKIFNLNSLLTVSYRFIFAWKAKVIPVYDGSSDLLSVLMEETGGLGVDIVVDSGGKVLSQITLSTQQNTMTAIMMSFFVFVFV